VFLGAVLATIGGFVATQLEWYIERRRRERSAALLFGEILSTMNIILTMTDETRKIGDPYGPITLRMLRSAIREVEIYDRNRETLFDLRDGELRARIHTLILRIVMPADGVFDTTNEIAAIQSRLNGTGLLETERQDCEKRMESLRTSRNDSFEFVMESSRQLKTVLKRLEPMAGHSFERYDEVVRNV
jgi:hypothetical protein